MSLHNEMDLELIDELNAHLESNPIPPITCANPECPQAGRCDGGCARNF